MKTFSIRCAGLVAGVCVAAPVLAAESGLQSGTYTLDPSHSYAHFTTTF